MSQPFRILTVCIGNVCRSPLMERLLRVRVPEQVEVASAGVNALAGYPMDGSAGEELRRLGGTADGFLARQLRASYVEQAGLVLTATVAVRSRVLEEVPMALRRTFTLLELAHLADRAPEGLESPEQLVAWAATNRSLATGQPLDVVDPIGAGPELHREAADAIDRGTARVAAILQRLSPSSDAPASSGPR